jgi:sulfide:quinone oxidoreductase
LLFLPFGMYGYRSQNDVVKPISVPLPRNVAFVPADVRLIDRAKREVQTDRGNFAYDFLISALGCRTAPEEIEGMGEAMGMAVHTFYTLDGALAMRKAMDGMNEGRLMIDICEMPIKGPVAPIEFPFLADYYFREKGVRDRIEISLVTPYTGAFTKPNANRFLSKVADEKGIKVVPNFATSAVDAAKKLIRMFDDRTVEYVLLCAIPPNLGPAVIDDSGLRDGAGYALTDPRTLKSPQGGAHLPDRRQHERRHVEGGFGRPLRGRDGRREPAARDRQQAAALDLRWPRQLLRRDRASQGDAGRFQPRH